MAGRKKRPKLRFNGRYFVANFYKPNGKRSMISFGSPEDRSEKDRNIAFETWLHLYEQFAHKVLSYDSRLTIASRVDFFPGCYLSIGDWETSFIDIGHHTHFAPHGVLYGWGGLKIGPYCNFSSHVVLATVVHHHEITDQPMALTGEKAAPITIEEDVWVAANSTVNLNTTIAKGCVIGANSVVTKNTEPMGIYFGTPARRVRDR